MSCSRKNALITGASSGIGYELAKLFARDSYGLVLVARDRAALERVSAELTRAHGCPVRVIARDLALPGAAVAVYEEIERASLDVDVLVNNAGFGVYGAFVETDLKAELDMLQLNIVALTHLSKLFLKKMLTKSGGKILNVASTAAFQPGPLMAVYYASKAFVLSFSEALASELRGSGVSVSTLCPGPTRTGFQRRANMDASKLFDWGVMDARAVAVLGYQGLMRGQAVIIPGLKNRLLAFSVRLAPRRFVPEVVRMLQGRRRVSASARNSSHSSST